jgi:hypothetical protein
MLFLKSTVAPLAPGLYLVDVAAKPPGRTFGVYIAIDADHPPQDLLNEIESLGFRRMLASPYTHQDGKKVLDLHYHKNGTDIFDGWTLAEKESNLKAIEELFGKLDIKIHPRVMTLAEAFA